MLSDRKIPVCDDISLIVLYSDEEKLSSDVRMQFPYKPLGEQLHYGIVHAIFALANQATKRGLKHPKGDYITMLVQPVIACPIDPSSDYWRLVVSGTDWLLEGTPESPRTLAISDEIVSGTAEAAVKAYLRAYVLQYAKENRFQLDQINYAMTKVADTAFDPKMAGGKWRLEKDGSITIYGGPTEIIKEISRHTHPGQLGNGIPLL